VDVAYTNEALENLAGTLASIASHYSAIHEAFQTLSQSWVLELENSWVLGPPGVQIVTLIRYT
jgi:hypothetical protein